MELIHLLFDISFICVHVFCKFYLSLFFIHGKWFTIHTVGTVAARQVWKWLERASRGGWVAVSLPGWAWAEMRKLTCQPGSEQVNFGPPGTSRGSTSRRSLVRQEEKGERSRWTLAQWNSKNMVQKERGTRERGMEKEGRKKWEEKKNKMETKVWKYGGEEGLRDRKEMREKPKCK